MILHFILCAYLYALGENDCGLNRLYPSDIWADTEYSSSHTAEKLIDGRSDTYWYSANGDMYDNVYVEFSNLVDVKHIMIKEGTYYVQAIYVYDDTTGGQMDYTNSDDPEDWKIYNFWFPKFVTSRVRVYFYGGEGSYITVSEISFWGCNVTSTSPTGLPTLSPTPMPTNATVTVLPTNMPSASPTHMPTYFTPSSQPTILPTVSPTHIPTDLPSTSPTQIPTNSTPSIQPTILPTVSPTHIPTTFPTMSPTQLPTLMASSSPSEPPSTNPTSSPSMAPTTTLVPSSSPTMTPTSSLLPTSSPTVYPTLEGSIPSDDGSTAAPTRKDNDHLITIGVIDTLIIVILLLIVALLYLGFQLHRRERRSRRSNVAAMMETHQQADKL